MRTKKEKGKTEEESAEKMNRSGVKLEKVAERKRKVMSVGKVAVERSGRR